MSQILPHALAPGSARDVSRRVDRHTNWLLPGHLRPSSPADKADLVPSRRKAIVAALALAALAAGVNADTGKVDLPVATEGTEQWAATVAKAMSYGAKDSGTAMTNFQSFQSRVMSNVQKQVSARRGQPARRVSTPGNARRVAQCYLGSSAGNL